VEQKELDKNEYSQSKYKKRPRRRIRGNEETGDKEGAMEVCKV
jgi:hypothetical protein